MRALSIACLGLLLTASLAATTVLPLTVEELTRQSSQVVEATALNSWTAWNAQHSMIFTYTRFSVSRTLKGDAAGSVVVREPGGSAGGYTTRVAGVRHWHSGEQAVLFLRPAPTADALEVTGLMQGNYLVSSGAGGQRTVSNGLPAVSRRQASPAPAENPGAPATYNLNDFEARVRKAATP